MRIGKLAAESGLSVKALRFYEDIGILDQPDRTSGGYRDYDPTVVDRLTFVRAAQAIGLSLGEIREIVALRERGETPCAHVSDLLARHTADIETRIAELEALRTELKRLERRAKQLDPEACDPTKICHLITPQARR